MRHEQKKKFNMSLYITLPMCSKCKHLLMKWTNINKQIHAQSFGTCYFRVQTSFLSKKKGQKGLSFEHVHSSKQNRYFFFSRKHRSAVFLCITKKKSDTFLPNKSVKITTTNSFQIKHFCSYRNNNTSYKALLNTLHPQNHILCLALYHWLILNKTFLCLAIHNCTKKCQEKQKPELTFTKRDPKELFLVGLKQ